MNISDKNFTEAIDDPIEDVYETETVVKYIHYIFLICTLVAFLCALAAKIFLVVTILRFKELRTRINMYIFNAVVIKSLAYLLTFIIYFDRFYNIIYTVYEAFSILFLMLLFTMVLDWMLMTFTSNWTLKTQTLYPLIFVVLFVLSFIVNFMHKMGSPLHIPYVVIYVAGVIFLLAVNIYIYKTNLPYEATKTVYCLTVANIFVLSWLPHFVLHYFLLIGLHAQWHVTLLIAGLFGYASPVVVVWILGRKNKHFKMAYDRSFKRSLSIYQNGNLDVSDDEECKTEDQIVRVHMNAEDVSIY